MKMIFWQLPGKIGTATDDRIETGPRRDRIEMCIGMRMVNGKRAAPKGVVLFRGTAWLTYMVDAVLVP